MFAARTTCSRTGNWWCATARSSKVRWGNTHVVKPTSIRGIERKLGRYFERYHTMRMDNFTIGDDEMCEDADTAAAWCTHACRRARRMIINGVAIDDTFAEAFGMRATRLIVTAARIRSGRARGGQP